MRHLGALVSTTPDYVAEGADINADPRDVDPMAIKDIGVVATILAGQVTLTSQTREPDWAVK